jgi:hypothetical protein
MTGENADLINRLAAATKSSRELDVEIALVEHPWLKDCPRNDVDGDPGWMTKHGRTYPSRYTEFVDSALELVPEGLLIAITIWLGTTIVRLRTGGILDPATKEWEASSKDTAIAIVIASLMAREGKP